VKNYQSVLIIYNPNAMKGKVDEYIPKIKQRLLLRFIQVDAMSSPEINGAETLANKYAGKYDIIVSCGGDGTLHNVINGIMKSEFRPTVAILPFGTCNDIARTLKIPFDLDKAIDCILRLNTTNYDLMSDGNQYISYSLATGYLVKSTYSPTNKLKRRFGRFAYFLCALKCLFKFDSIPITLTLEGERIHTKVAYLMVINGESAGGFHLNKNEVVNNGKVKMVLIKKTNPFSNFVTFMKLFFFGIKSIIRSKNTVVRDVKHLEIENHSNVTFVLDGEKTKFLRKEIEVNSQIEIIKK